MASRGEKRRVFGMVHMDMGTVVAGEHHFERFNSGIGDCGRQRPLLFAVIGYFDRRFDPDIFYW